MVNIFYQAWRALFLTSGIIQFLLFCRAAYKDRANMNWQTIKKVQVPRIFRVIGVIGSFFFVLLQIDNFGAFGIYTFPPRYHFTNIVFSLFWIACVVVMYNAVRATLVFLPNPEEKQKAVDIIFPVFGSVVLASCWIGFAVPYNAAYATLFFTCTLGCLFMIFGVNYVFFALRRHAKSVDGSVHLSKSSVDLVSKTVRAWRNYSIVITIVFALLLYAVAGGFVTIVQMPEVGGASASFPSQVNSDERPGFGRLVQPIVYHIVYWVFLKRAWKDQATQQETARKSGGHGSSDVSSTKSGTANSKMKMVKSDRRAEHSTTYTQTVSITTEYTV